MKLQIINAVLFLSLSQLSFAESPSEPEHCPTVSSLQAVGIQEMIQDRSSWYGAVLSDNYTTADNWTFVIGEFKAKNESDARKKATEAIKSLNHPEGPLPFNINGEEKWVCYYNNKSGHHAVTVTPALSFLHSQIHSITRTLR